MNADTLIYQSEETENELEALENSVCPECGEVLSIHTEFGVDHKIKEVAECLGCGYTES